MDLRDIHTPQLFTYLSVTHTALRASGFLQFGNKWHASLPYLVHTKPDLTPKNQDWFSHTPTRTRPTAFSSQTGTHPISLRGPLDQSRGGALGIPQPNQEILVFHLYPTQPAFAAWWQASYFIPSAFKQRQKNRSKSALIWSYLMRRNKTKQTNKKSLIEKHKYQPYLLAAQTGVPARGAHTRVCVCVRAVRSTGEACEMKSERQQLGCKITPPPSHWPRP